MAIDRLIETQKGAQAPLGGDVPIRQISHGVGRFGKWLKSQVRKLVLNDLEATHPVTLRFDDPCREKAFLHEHLASSLATIRLFVAFGNLLYALFGILDSIAVPGMARFFWVIRGVVLLINCGIVLPFTFSKNIFKNSQVILSICMLTSGDGIIMMLATAPPPVNQFYYAGLIMVVVYCSSLIRLHHLNALFISLFLFVSYQFIAVWTNPIPETMLISNDFFLTMSIILGAFSSYVQEVYVRKNYVNLELLAEGKATAERLQEAAESANRAKSEFLAIMSHELRTPLNAIIGFSDIMKEEMFGPIGSPRYSDYARDISTSGNHLLDIINAILDLSKAESGRLELEESEVDLRDVAKACLRVFREIAASRGVRLILIEPTRSPIICADERLCKQIILNLVSNGIKFTRPGGEVTISFPFPSNNARAIRVEDNGIGISETDMPRVLEPFIQVDSSISRKYGGTGLGLPLVRKIIELHGGELELSSRIGVGTNVVAAFPPERTRVGSPKNGNNLVLLWGA